jgi:hypothetical protein
MSARTQISNQNRLGVNPHFRQMAYLATPDKIPEPDCQIEQQDPARCPGEWASIETVPLPRPQQILLRPLGVISTKFLQNA